MLRIKKAFLTALMCLMAVCLLSACKKKGDQNDPTEESGGEIPVPTATPTPAPTVTPTPTPDVHPGEKRSWLTGEWIPEEEADARPFAVIFNNIKVASPQSGIGEADILYEALTEGGITRFLGICGNVETDRLGSVRSARHYFVSFAQEYDAMFIHYGKTTYATKKIKATGIDDVDGTGGSGASTFYRDSSIKAPHNAFTSKELLDKTVEKLKLETKHAQGYQGTLKFQEEDTAPNAGGTVQNAEKVTLGFSSYTSPYFEYHKEDGLYYRFQFGKEHVDYNTKEQLAFKNLLIQFVKEWDIDKNGYQTMELDGGSGSGYFITNGAAVPITWKKQSQDEITRYYHADGTEISLNPGKTYIAVFPDSRTAKAVIE